MALSDLYVPGTIDSGGGGSEFLSPTRSYSAAEIGVGGPGPGAGDFFDVGKAAFKYLAPETYADATSWLPSWGDITSGVEGFFGGGADAAGSFMDLPAFGGGEVAGGGLGGAAAAFGPAAAFLAWAKLMKALNQNTDHPITLGSGYTSLTDGFTDGWGPKVGEAQALGDIYIGDRSWYEGGDPSMVEPLDTAVGSMSWKKNIPAFTVGGAPYRTPDLAAGSGRQIARGMMGLTVDHEALPGGFGPISDPAMAGTLNAQSLPVWDAPQQMPTDWDMWQERAQNSSWSGQGNTEAGAWAPEAIDAYVGQQTPRGQDFFRTSLTSGDLYAYTGEQSPDWGRVVGGDEFQNIQGNFNQPTERPTLQGYNWGAIG